jgi:hypothetical protein
MIQERLKYNEWRTSSKGLRSRRREKNRGKGACGERERESRSRFKMGERGEGVDISLLQIQIKFMIPTTLLCMHGVPSHGNTTETSDACPSDRVRPKANPDHPGTEDREAGLSRIPAAPSVDQSVLRPGV